MVSLIAGHASVVGRSFPLKTSSTWTEPVSPDGCIAVEIGGKSVFVVFGSKEAAEEGVWHDFTIGDPFRLHVEISPPFREGGESQVASPKGLGTYKLTENDSFVEIFPVIGKSARITLSVDKQVIYCSYGYLGPIPPIRLVKRKALKGSARKKRTYTSIESGGNEVAIVQCVQAGSGTQINAINFFKK